MRLLLIEDTGDVAEAVARSFALRGDAVDHAATLTEADGFLRAQPYDVVILDIGLPDGEGTEVLRALRARGDGTPVLMLTARGAVEDRVAALDLGADDYMVKPFDLRELQARVRALARRGAGGERAGTLSFGRLEFDPAGRELSVAGVPVVLTRREFSLLEILLRNRGRVVPKERLHEHLFSFADEEIGMNAVETQIARLRRKIEGGGVTLHTLRGLGYQLVADD